MSLGLNEFKSGSHSEAPFNLFHAPLTTCLGSLLWSTPLQNSLISVKISRAGECLPHSLNARALFSIRQSPAVLIFTMGIPWKVVFWYWDRFQFIDFLSFVAMTLRMSRKSVMEYSSSKLPYFSKNLKSWWMPASLSECKSSILDKTVSGCLIFTMGIPWKVVFWYWDRFQFIDFLSFVAMTAYNSYRRCHMPCHIGDAGFVQEHIRWWSGWRFIQCSPPVGGVKQIR